MSLPGVKRPDSGDTAPLLLAFAIFFAAVSLTSSACIGSPLRNRPATNSTGAPLNEDTSLDTYDEECGCYYNFQHYSEGDRIMTNEPCLNCTCHNRMLMCYLRVCPFTKPIGHDCTIEKRGDQCCPVITCPDVRVDLLTTTLSPEAGATDVGNLDPYGCMIENRFYTEGAQVPINPDKPCELCYCVRNMTACVMQECTLHVDGCTPVYHRGVCCPVRYSCEHPEEEMPLMIEGETTTLKPTEGFVITTTIQPGASKSCKHNEKIYGDGVSIATDKMCEHCYCMRGHVVCAVQECGMPMENEGKNCTALPPREGQCCPDTYVCEDIFGTTIDSEVTPKTQEEITESTPITTEFAESSEITKLQPELVTEFTTLSGETNATIVPTTEKMEIITLTATEKIQSTPESIKEEIITTPTGLVSELTTTTVYQPLKEDTTEKEIIPTTEVKTETSTVVTGPEESTIKEEIIPTTETKLQTAAVVAEYTENEPSESELEALSTTIIPTSINEEENEISELEQTTQIPSRIPGEGSCLVDGITYMNSTYIPVRNKCQSSCKCISSIVRCDTIPCSPPPSNEASCQLVYNKDACCPTYTCVQPSPELPSADNQMTEFPVTDEAKSESGCAFADCIVSTDLTILKPNETKATLPVDKEITPVEPLCDKKECQLENRIPSIPDETEVSTQNSLTIHQVTEITELIPSTESATKESTSGIEKVSTISSEYEEKEKEETSTPLTLEEQSTVKIISSSTSSIPLGETTLSPEIASETFSSISEHKEELSTLPTVILKEKEKEKEASSTLPTTEKQSTVTITSGSTLPVSLHETTSITEVTTEVSLHETKEEMSKSPIEFEDKEEETTITQSTPVEISTTNIVGGSTSFTSISETTTLPQITTETYSPGIEIKEQSSTIPAIPEIKEKEVTSPPPTLEEQTTNEIVSGSTPSIPLTETTASPEITRETNTPTIEIKEEISTLPTQFEVNEEEVTSTTSTPEEQSTLTIFSSSVVPISSTETTLAPEENKVEITTTPTEFELKEKEATTTTSMFEGQSTTIKVSGSTPFVFSGETTTVLNTASEAYPSTNENKEETNAGPTDFEVKNKDAAGETTTIPEISSETYSSIYEINEQTSTIPTDNEEEQEETSTQPTTVEESTAYTISSLVPSVSLAESTASPDIITEKNIPTVENNEEVSTLSTRIEMKEKEATNVPSTGIESTPSLSLVETSDLPEVTSENYSPTTGTKEEASTLTTELQEKEMIVTSTQVTPQEQNAINVLSTSTPFVASSETTALPEIVSEAYTTTTHIKEEISTLPTETEEKETEISSTPTIYQGEITTKVISSVTSSISLAETTALPETASEAYSSTIETKEEVSTSVPEFEVKEEESISTSPTPEEQSTINIILSSTPSVSTGEITLSPETVSYSPTTETIEKTNAMSTEFEEKEEEANIISSSTPSVALAETTVIPEITSVTGISIIENRDESSTFPTILEEKEKEASSTLPTTEKQNTITTISGSPVSLHETTSFTEVATETHKPTTATKEEISKLPTEFGEKVEETTSTQPTPAEVTTINIISGSIPSVSSGETTALPENVNEDFTSTVELKEEFSTTQVEYGTTEKITKKTPDIEAEKETEITKINEPPTEITTLPTYTANRMDTTTEVPLKVSEHQTTIFEPYITTSLSPQETQEAGVHPIKDETLNELDLGELTELVSEYPKVTTQVYEVKEYETTILPEQPTITEKAVSPEVSATLGILGEEEKFTTPVLELSTPEEEVTLLFETSTHIPEMIPEATTKVSFEIPSTLTVTQTPVIEYTEQPIGEEKEEIISSTPTQEVTSETQGVEIVTVTPFTEKPEEFTKPTSTIKEEATTIEPVESEVTTIETLTEEPEKVPEPEMSTPISTIEIVTHEVLSTISPEMHTDITSEKLTSSVTEENTSIFLTSTETETTVLSISEEPEKVPEPEVSTPISTIEIVTHEVLSTISPEMHTDVTSEKLNSLVTEGTTSILLSSTEMESISTTASSISEANTEQPKITLTGVITENVNAMGIETTAIPEVVTLLPQTTARTAEILETESSTTEVLNPEKEEELRTTQTTLNPTEYYTEVEVQTTSLPEITLNPTEYYTEVEVQTTSLPEITISTTLEHTGAELSKLPVTEMSTSSPVEHEIETEKITTMLSINEYSTETNILMSTVLPQKGGATLPSEAHIKSEEISTTVVPEITEQTTAATQYENEKTEQFKETLKPSVTYSPPSATETLSVFTEIPYATSEEQTQSITSNAATPASSKSPELITTAVEIENTTPISLSTLVAEETKPPVEVSSLVTEIPGKSTAVSVEGITEKYESSTKDIRLHTTAIEGVTETSKSEISTSLTTIIFEEEAMSTIEPVTYTELTETTTAFTIPITETVTSESTEVTPITPSSSKPTIKPIEIETTKESFAIETTPSIITETETESFPTVTIEPETSPETEATTSVFVSELTTELEKEVTFRPEVVTRIVPELTTPSLNQETEVITEKGLNTAPVSEEETTLPTVEENTGVTEEMLVAGASTLPSEVSPSTESPLSYETLKEEQIESTTPITNVELSTTKSPIERTTLITEEFTIPQETSVMTSEKVLISTLPPKEEVTEQLSLSTFSEPENEKTTSVVQESVTESITPNSESATLAAHEISSTNKVLISEEISTKTPEPEISTTVLPTSAVGDETVTDVTKISTERQEETTKQLPTVTEEKQVTLFESTTPKEEKEEIYTTSIPKLESSKTVPPYLVEVQNLTTIAYAPSETTAAENTLSTILPISNTPGEFITTAATIITEKSSEEPFYTTVQGTGYTEVVKEAATLPITEKTSEGLTETTGQGISIIEEEQESSTHPSVEKVSEQPIIPTIDNFTNLKTKLEAEGITVRMPSTEQITTIKPETTEEIITPEEIEKEYNVSPKTEKPTEETPISETTENGEIDDRFNIPETTPTQLSEFPPSGYGQPEGEIEYEEQEQEQVGPGTCRYSGKVYVSAQQIPRDDPCDFCFCFRSDIICLQQSCPPPIHGCHEEPIQGFCCPRYECPVSMATALNVTTTTTTTTTTLPPHFLPHAYKGAARRQGCQIKGHAYKVGEVVRSASGPCLHCTCGGDGQMKCEPKVCTPEPMLRQMIAAAVSSRRRR